MQAQFDEQKRDDDSTRASCGLAIPLQRLDPLVVLAQDEPGHTKLRSVCPLKVSRRTLPLLSQPIEAVEDGLEAQGHHVLESLLTRISADRWLLHVDSLNGQSRTQPTSPKLDKALSEGAQTANSEWRMANSE